MKAFILLFSALCGSVAMAQDNVFGKVVGGPYFLHNCTSAKNNLGGNFQYVVESDINDVVEACKKQGGTPREGFTSEANVYAYEHQCYVETRLGGNRVEVIKSYKSNSQEACENLGLIPR